MGSQVLVNAKLWCGAFDWTGDVNALALKFGAEAKDTTVLGSAARTRTPGLESFSFQHEGFWSGGLTNVDDAIFNSVFAIANTPMSIDPQGSGVEGDVAYTGLVDLARYTPGAKVGDMLAFSVAGDGDGARLVRGTLMGNRTVVASGNGTVFQLGAVSAAQKIYAALHVPQGVSGAAPTLDVKLQSAALVGFGSPTDRITFSQKTAAGYQWGTAVAGSITDQFWRVVWTVGGGTPSFPFVVVAGIR